MKKLLKKSVFDLIAVVLLFSIGQTAYAAIALYGATNVLQVFNTTIDGGSGPNRVIIYAGAGDTSDNLTSVTWGGESFTKLVDQFFPGTTRFNYVWCLNPIGTGNQNFVANGIVNSSVMTVLVYTGAGSCKNANTASGIGTSGSVSLTAADGDWLVGGGGNDVGTIAVGSNTTARGLTGSSQGQADSNGVASPTALNFTFPNSNWTAYGVVISPIATPINGTPNRLAKFITTNTIGNALLSDDGLNTTLTSGNLFLQISSLIDSVTNGVLNFGTTQATTMNFGRSGQNMIINSKVGIGTNNPTVALHVNGGLFTNFINILADGLGLDTDTPGTLSVGSTTASAIKIGRTGIITTFPGTVSLGTLSTISNCASITSPANCAAASAGGVALPNGGTTLTVITTAVTANSQILITEDSSLGSRLGITCNVGTGRHYRISARMPGLSFTVRSNTAPIVNPACLSYWIVN